ncbi:MAG: diguanylate cyclase [Bdellovibrionales bacterium]|nr:diguanylate cyclase [Bdellovibrionales bacterium]
MTVDNRGKVNSFAEWIKELKNHNSFSSSIEFFVKTSGFPVLYFEYQSFPGWLSLKQSNHLEVDDTLCFRLYESDPSFDPAQLYNPKQISVFHSQVQKLFNTQEYQYFPLVFNKKVIALFAFLYRTGQEFAPSELRSSVGKSVQKPHNSNKISISDSSMVWDQLFVLQSYVKEFLWKDKWEKNSPIDGLTGCFNKRYFLKQLFVEFSRARRLQLPLSLILLRLDQLKTLESVYGSYKTGLFIKSFMNNMVKDSRAYDILGAWPEGYLGLILPHTSERGASMKAEQIRWSVESADFSKVFPSHGRLTLSLGLAEYPRVNRSADSLFQSTLKALSFAHDECDGNMTAVATPVVGFKPDFLVQNTVNSLRDLT